ncbi:MAG TPA: hypothetical protein VJM15_02995 [Sphingomicrobium sp.]|nr:hypothetical protein [Sphingomicrobium sp.]
MILLFALALAVDPAGLVPTGPTTDAVIANCNARKFETVVQTTRNGMPHSSKVTLCGEVGQTDADWSRTLRDALQKVSADPKMPAAVRNQIVTALNIEIAKLPSPVTAVPTGPAVVDQPGPIAPSLAQSPALPARTVVSPPAEYSSLPPFPPPPLASPSASTSVVAAAVPALPRLNLKMTCLNPASIADEGPCDQFDRDTRLTIRAGEDIPMGTSLRFVRRGDPRAEVELAGLKNGRSKRMLLPPEVCRGVAGSRIQIEIVRRPARAGAQPQVVDSFGPFDLRC